MTTLALDNLGPHLKADERVAGVEFVAGALNVTLMDGRTITVPLYWYPRLQGALDAKRRNRRIAGGGYGLHWPDADEERRCRINAGRPHGAAPRG